MLSKNEYLASPKRDDKKQKQLTMERIVLRDFYNVESTINPFVSSQQERRGHGQSGFF
jgi:hypothetical protein